MIAYSPALDVIETAGDNFFQQFGMLDKDSRMSALASIILKHVTDEEDLDHLINLLGETISEEFQFSF